MHQETENNLQTHEWMVILFLIAFLAVLTTVSHSCSSTTLPKTEKQAHTLFKHDIEVFVEGAVEHPGKYSVKKGTKIDDLLMLAVPKDSADLKSINKEKTLKNKQKIIVSEQEFIKITLRFKDKTLLDLNVPKGVKLKDLPLIYAFNENVDVEKFKSNRRLKDGQVVKVPFKK